MNTASNAQKSNVIIGGNFRGGTSVLTRLVVAAGYDLPGSFGRNYEDQRFLKELHRIKRPSKKNLRLLIDQNNNDYDQWVLKYPAIFKSFKTLLPLLTNPKIILITREPVAVALSELKNKQQKDFNNLLLRTAEYNYEMVKAFLKYQSKYPSLLISYEKLVLYPLETATELTTFLEAGDPNQLAEFVTDRQKPWPILVEPNDV